jgi:hypothetical protein
MNDERAHKFDACEPRLTATWKVKTVKRGSLHERHQVRKSEILGGLISGHSRRERRIKVKRLQMDSASLSSGT